jgi:cupin 2 domain-containing protein
VTLPRPGHLLAGLDASATEERFDELLRAPGVLVERIVSPPGYRAPADEWLEQERAEFVVVLVGRGALQFDGGDEIVLNPGDTLHLPAGLRHRVAWTDAHQPTVWLAVHHDGVTRATALAGTASE